jgi:hypothetical protein
MEKQKPLGESILIVAFATLLILSIPFVAMQFNTGVDWSVFDFAIAGTLLFTTGLILMFVMRTTSNLVYRVASVLGIGTVFFMFLANLAVGLIGSGPHAGNFMYIGVLIVGIIGAIRSKFNAEGMEQTMYAMAIVLAIIAAVALIMNMDEYPGSSVVEILGVNAFFAVPLLISGLLFRYITKGQPGTRQNLHG